MNSDSPAPSPQPEEKSHEAGHTPAAEAEAREPARTTEPDERVERQMRAMSRRSFLWGVAALGSGYSGWRWLISRRDEDGVPWPFRRALQNNEELARDYFRTTRLAPTFSKSQVSPLRVNGDVGLSDDFDPSAWTLHVEGLANEDGFRDLTLKDIKALPRAEMTTELKCIEGWSVIVHWAGARLSDFMAKYPPATRSGDAPDIKNKPQDLPAYVSLMTPDEGYYVGLDMESALHPQTLLCYEMNGKPLTLEHGAPLRLAIPVKYGIKNIKRIGTIAYTNRRPADYWAEQGYDWYAGH
jgi:DMSO/TMAO reductase YedYZ molybdopterin-dependent catalytic subunit